jgi:diguanylate cyclase (GGDEF)-like protein
MQLVTALIYWIIVALWAAVLAIVLINYIRNPRIFGTTRLLLLVLAIDTCRNIVENTYFGLFFGGRYGLFPSAFAQTLGNPALVIVPKLINIGAGCLVLGLLLMRWLPRAVTERGHSEKLAADLELLATRDGLTGLFNRRHFDNLARAEWARFQRYGRPLSLLVMDADNFKSINDRFGHDVGDLVLKAIADTCSASKRETDVVARFGGEEFVLLLPETDEAAAVIVAERLRTQIQQHSRVHAGEKLQVTVSIGVAGATLSMSGFNALLKRADVAMYEAKRSGRNRVVRAPRKITEQYKVAAE